MENKMNMKYLVAASVVALTAASSVQAADVIMAQESASVVAAPVFSWTGFYAGGQIGGSWSDSTVKGRGNAFSPIAGFGLSHSPDLSGFIAGLYLGYNYDLGNNIVLGAETDWAWGDMDDSSRSDYIFENRNVGELRGKIKEKWAGATRIRVGYAMDRWLPYIAGGVAYAKIDSSLRSNNMVRAYAPTFDASNSDTMTGWTIGAGVDYAMTVNVILRAEYRNSDFDDKDYSKDDIKYTVDHKTNDFRVGVAYKF